MLTWTNSESAVTTTPSKFFPLDVMLYFTFPLFPFCFSCYLFIQFLTKNFDDGWDACRGAFKETSRERKIVFKTGCVGGGGGGLPLWHHRARICSTACFYTHFLKSAAKKTNWIYGRTFSILLSSLTGWTHVFFMIIKAQRGHVSAHCTTAPTLFETQHLCKGAHNLKGSSWLSSSFCAVFFLSFSVCLSRCKCKEVRVRRRGRKSRRRRKKEEGFLACGTQTDNFNVIRREDQRCGEPLFFLSSQSGFLKGGGYKSSGFETHHHHHHRQQTSMWKVKQFWFYSHLTPECFESAITTSSSSISRSSSRSSSTHLFFPSLEVICSKEKNRSESVFTSPWCSWFADEPAVREGSGTVAQLQHLPLI